MNNIYESVFSHKKTICFLNFATQSLKNELNNLSNYNELNNAINNNNNNNSLITTNNNEIDGNVGGSWNFDTIDTVLLNLPRTILVSKIKGLNTIINVNESMEAKQKQLKKDIERERLIVNGIPLVGAELGLNKILENLYLICDDILVNCNLPILTSKIKKELCFLALMKASRTHSGGIAFQTLHSLIKDPNKVMLFPLSSITPPIKLYISIGSFSDFANHCIENNDKISNNESIDNIDYNKAWGIKIKIKCESLFQIHYVEDEIIENYDNNSNLKLDTEFKEENVKKPLKKENNIRVIFEDCVGFQIKMFNSEIENLENFIGKDLINGKVSILSVNADVE
jgi:hypothetical protein